MICINPLSIEWPDSPKKTVPQRLTNYPMTLLYFKVNRNSSTQLQVYVSLLYCFSSRKHRFAMFYVLRLPNFVRKPQTSRHSTHHLPKAPQHDTSGTIASRRRRRTLRTAQGPLGRPLGRPLGPLGPLSPMPLASTGQTPCAKLSQKHPQTLLQSPTCSS